MNDDSWHHFGITTKNERRDEADVRDKTGSPGWTRTSDTVWPRVRPREPITGYLPVRLRKPSPTPLDREGTTDARCTKEQYGGGWVTVCE
jgi:hypothetical protein